MATSLDFVVSYLQKVYEKIDNSFILSVVLDYNQIRNSHLQMNNYIIIVTI